MPPWKFHILQNIMHDEYTIILELEQEHPFLLTSFTLNIYHDSAEELK